MRPQPRSPSSPGRELPEHIPSLAELYDAVGTALPLSLDVKDPRPLNRHAAGGRGQVGADAELWLCHPDWELLARGGHGRRGDAGRLDPHRNGSRKGRSAGPCRCADAGIDCINMHECDWSAGLTTLFHRFGIECFGWDAQLPRVLDQLLAKGVDAVYSDHVDRMVDALARLP